ncbi:transcriptional repressor [bacterium]|nr:transcriptional repressor [bacterium]
MKESIEHKALRERGLRITQPRIVVYRALADVKAPLTAQEIVHSARLVDQATVYRTLELFVEAGIARKVNLQSGLVRYELNSDDHHHLTCTRCERVEDFRGCHVEKISSHALAHSRFFSTITSHSLELFGLCNSCSRT